MSKVILSVKDLNVSYGSIRAVKNISFEVQEGEIVTLIGANGAGKSTTLNAIARLLPASGEIRFAGEMKPFILINPEDDSMLQLTLPVRSYD